MTASTDMTACTAQAASTLVTTLDNRKRKDLNDWKREVEEAFEDDGDEPVALKMSGKLMSFDKSGKLVVHFSERLVNLLREARQLCAIGCQVLTPTPPPPPVGVGVCFFCLWVGGGG